MKVIFKKNNEVKNVASGFALNYLIPQSLAVVATEEEIKKLEIKKLKESRYKQQRKKEEKMLAEKLKETKIKIPVKSSKDGKLFGSVTKLKIEKALEDLKVDLRGVEVLLEKPIKKIGNYKIDLKIGNERISIYLLVKSE